VSAARLFFWTAAMVAAAALVPLGAEILGMHLAGSFWNALRLTWPWLAPAGDALGGLIGGALIGLVQRTILPRPRPPLRWIAAAALGGLGIGVAHALWLPLALLAAPVAGALAGMAQRRSSRWPRAQSLAAAWVALAQLLPFPGWARAAFLIGAAVLSAWGVNIAP
jgi:hypothetical protein